MFKKLLMRAFGFDKLVLEAQQDAKEALEIAKAAQEVASEATLAAKRAIEDEQQSKLTPKERATARNEPWVGVLQTHVNADNVRNGFFELDWNELFVKQLIDAGYGFEADPQEQIIDRWFRDLASNMLAEEGYAGSVSAGIVDTSAIKNIKGN